MAAGDRVWRERGLRQAVLAGDEQAWRTWYEKSYAGLRAYVLWRCGGLRDHADEVIQDTWLTAVRRLRSFAPETASFAVWLRGIAANLLRNHFRQHGRRQRRLRPLHADDEQLANTDADAQRQQAEQVARALDSLPEHYEAVLRAKYLEGQSVADIAAARNDTAKAVESLLTRARQAFRTAYEQSE
jgi:RNA polymerase sigma-70 factor (ECF subfamily)